MPNNTSKRGPKSDAVWASAIRKAVMDIMVDDDPENEGQSEAA